MGTLGLCEACSGKTHNEHSELTLYHSNFSLAGNKKWRKRTIGVFQNPKTSLTCNILMETQAMWEGRLQMSWSQRLKPIEDNPRKRS